MSVAESQQLTGVHRLAIQVSSRQKAARVQGWRAAGRALISGYVDSFTLLNFGVYASFMSGNTTSAGLHAGHAKFALAGHSLLPIPWHLHGHASCPGQSTSRVASPFLSGRGAAHV